MLFSSEYPLFAKKERKIITKSANFIWGTFPSFLLVNNISKIRFNFLHIFQRFDFFSDFREFGNVSFLFIIDFDFLFKFWIKIFKNRLLIFKDISQFIYLCYHKQALNLFSFAKKLIQLKHIFDFVLSNISRQSHFNFLD